MEKREKKLTKRQLFGYGIAGLGDNGSYSLITSFLLFFLTSVAHVPTIAAGFINTIGGVWNAILSPCMGYVSDNTRNKYGRRHPFIFVGSFLLLVSISLLFTDIGLSTNGKIVYYCIFTVLFWTAFCTFFIPYLALGAAMTSDYDERTHVRMYASTFNLLGGILGMVVPSFIISVMVKKGLSQSMSWQIAGYIVASIAFLSILYTWKETRWVRELDNIHIGKNTVLEKSQKSKVLLNMLREYKQVLTLKPMKFLALGSVFYLVVNTIYFSVRMYLVTYNLNLSAPTITVVFLYAGCIGIVMIPLSRKLSSMFGKQKAFIIAASCGIAGGIFFGLTGIDNLFTLVVYMFVIGFPTSAYWQLFPSMIYDICEVDEFVYEKRRQGIVVSIQSLAESTSAAFTTLLVSIILEVSGFDGAVKVQTPTTENWILYTYTFVPALFLLLSVLMVYLYPLSKDKFHILKRALHKKKQGEKPDTNGLDRII